MKTSIFNMNFVLPPMVEMTEVVKDMLPEVRKDMPWSGSSNWWTHHCC